jgi:hypothetical protein
VLQRRIDAFYLAFRGQLAPTARTLLAARTSEAKAAHTSVAVDIAGIALVLHLHSRDGWWRLENDDLALTIQDGDHLRGWTIEVRPNAQALAEHGPRAMLATARRLAGALLASVEGERVRRLDLCADVVGFALGDIHAKQWITPRRSSAACAHFKGSTYTGWTIGKGNIVCRIYDKTEELRASSPAVQDRRAAEHARWSAAGWNGTDAVTRVEFQIRGAALKELERGALRDPETALATLDPVWRYCARSWLRLAVVGSAPRRDRWRTDPRWKTIQAVAFNVNDDGEIATRTRHRSPARARFAVSAAIQYAASRQVLRPVPVASGLRHVERWTDERAAAFVRDHVRAVLHTAAEAGADELLTAYGAKLAAAFVIERRNAAWARTARDASMSRRPLAACAEECAP